MKKTKRNDYISDYEKEKIIYNEISDEIYTYYFKEKGQVIPPESVSLEKILPEGIIVDSMEAYCDPKELDKSEDSDVSEDQAFSDDDDDFYNKAKDIHNITYSD